jgi:hypothetical protein
MTPQGPTNRYQRVLAEASELKAQQQPWQRPSLAEEFYRENPMPWLLDADPVDEPDRNGQRRSA